MENYKIPYEAIEDLEEELEELNMENEWGKTATLKYNEVLQENKKLKYQVEAIDKQATHYCIENNKLKEENETLKNANSSYEDLLAGDGGTIDKINELKEENKNLRIVMNWSQPPRTISGL